MDMQHISLATLLQNTRNYNQMPIPFQQLLKRSVWISLITEAAFLIVFITVPHENLLLRVSGGGFIIIGAEFIHSLLAFSYQALPYLALINLINLFVTLHIISLSLGMLIPVRIRYHYLAVANALPTVASIVSIAFVILLLTLAFVINLIIWLLIISIMLTIIIGIIANIVS